MAKSKTFQEAVMKMSKNIQTKTTTGACDQKHMRVWFNYNGQNYRIDMFNKGDNLLENTMNKKLELLLESAKNDTNDIESLETLSLILYANFSRVDTIFYYTIPEYFRDVKVNKNEVNDLLKELFNIINMKGKNMVQAMECIAKIKDDENKGYQYAEKLFLQEDWSKYPDFLVTLIFFLSILDDKFKKHLPKVVEYYKKINDPFFRECVGNELKFYGCL